MTRRRTLALPKAACWTPHSVNTNGSFTAVKTMTSAPAALNLSRLATKPGRWVCGQKECID